MALLKYPGYSAIRQKDASFTEINPSQTCLDDSTISISAAAEQSNVKPSILTKDNDAICGFDHEAGKVWIYPTNFPERTYQLTIAKHALFENTLVTLPTGLGKTFIAAVVMYNFYRWYPLGKVVFMAPTKPLVQQQLRACYEVMGIPQEHMILMTGASNSPQARIELWKERRVFFLTPQVMANDLRKGVCPAKLIKCLVIDEAHKATGNHAYCEVVRSLVTTAKHFRVMALSATPGSDVQAVQQVLTNLLITRMELRSEESLDVQPYCFLRETKKIVVPLGKELRELEQRFGAMVEKVLAKLERFNVIQKRPLSTWSKYQLLQAKDQFNRNSSAFAANQRGAIMGNFASAVSLLHAYELLLMYGMKSFRYFIQSTLDGDKGNSRSKGELSQSPEFQCFWNDIKAKLDTVSQTDATSTALQSHPKLQELVNILLDHFKEKGNESTRVMIFSQYRPSVQEIGDLLKRYDPIIKPVQFVGQGQSGGASKGISQKEQMRVVREFQAGNYNTLVATCIGEEGLDIGEVDLIICYDAPSSPTRLVQRMGRTGRKRNGKIVVLVSEGKEEHLYNRSQYSKKKIHKAILANKKFSLYADNPRMIPPQIKPQLMKLSIKPNKPFDQKLKNKTNKRTFAAETLNSFGKRSLASYTGYLDAEEEKLLKQDYEIDQFEQKQVKALPRSGKLEILGQNTRKINGKRMDYGVFIGDQATLQSVSAIAHSSRTVAFANVMNFCDFRRFLDADDNSYELELRTFIQDENDLRKVEDGSALFGRIERKFCLDEQEIKSGEKENSQAIEQKTIENPIDDDIDDDNYLAQLWECGLSSQACVPFRQETPRKQIPKTKESQTPNLKPETKKIMNETPKMKIPKRNASFSRKTSRAGPLDFFVKRESNTKVFESGNAISTNFKSENRNANVFKSGNGNANDNFLSNAATCSNPVMIFDDDDDELLAKMDFDFDDHPTIAKNSIKSEPDLIKNEANIESQQIFLPSTMQSNCNLNFDFDFDNAIKPEQDILRLDSNAKSQQKSAWPSTMQSQCNLNFDFDDVIKPGQEDPECEANDKSQQKSVLPLTMQSQCNLNFDFDDVIKPQEKNPECESNAKSQQKSVLPLTMQSQCNLNFDFDDVIKPGPENPECESNVESQKNFWASTMKSNCNLNFDLDLIGVEENESKRSLPQTIAPESEEDDLDLDVIPPTPERPKTRVVLTKLNSPINSRPEKFLSSKIDGNFLSQLKNHSQPVVFGNEGDDEEMYRINPFLLGTIQFQARDRISTTQDIGARTSTTQDSCTRISTTQNIGARTSKTQDSSARISTTQDIGARILTTQNSSARMMVADSSNCLAADSSDCWNIETPAKSVAKPIETSTPAIDSRNRASTNRFGPTKRLIISSDDDSPVVSAKNRRKPKRIMSDDEEDDDNQNEYNNQDENYNQDDDDVVIVAENSFAENVLPPDSPPASGSEPPPSPPELNARPNPQRRRKFQNEMIEWEASESAFADSQGQIRLPRSRDDSDVSTDDEGGWLPDSFVDFNSQPEYHSTESGKDESEMYAVYVQSVKDQVGPSGGRYKLTYGLNAEMDVFSQAPGPEYQQSYEMDTFCVPNDFVEYASGSDENGNGGVKSAGKQRRKRRPRKANQLGKRRRLADASDSD